MFLPYLANHISSSAFSTAGLFSSDASNYLGDDLEPQYIDQGQWPSFSVRVRMTFLNRRVTSKPGEDRKDVCHSEDD